MAERQNSFAQRRRGAECAEFFWQSSKQNRVAHFTKIVEKPEMSRRCPVKIHDVQRIEFEGSKMILSVDGQTYRVDLPSVSARLAGASETARHSYSVSPS